MTVMLRRRRKREVKIEEEKQVSSFGGFGSLIEKEPLNKSSFSTIRRRGPQITKKHFGLFLEGWHARNGKEVELQTRWMGSDTCSLR
jgi:hypothetical protein